MKIIYTKYFPPGCYHTMNLFGILFTKKKLLSPITINHETIHTKLMQEMLYIGFYIWYIIEYILVRLFHKKQNDSYHDISLEEEAHNNDLNLDYLKTRNHYAWFKYIKIRSNEIH